ncbi:NIPSNAP family protein [Polynucleobacter kasalickyi]|uniref:NIPSNAP protein n=1 Tax=Polynucleobacter kasalickyi TaxID=1938817 RepID=A0A1W1YZQ3_9BURK|nr:NIPSNAP family protein [Polynucleobacter kasalickyi]SMC41670.1 NIPSNAP protein [Polynucleobacter kasalickyi]
MKSLLKVLLSISLCISALTSTSVFAQTSNQQRVFELRTYTSHENRLGDVVARFKNHTTRFFERHGITNIGYWIPTDQPNTLIYIVSHASREQAKKNWEAFQKDPEWMAAREASMANGPIVVKTQSVFMEPTEFSPIK